MLDPWIVDEVRRRDQAQRREDRPMLELPLVDPLDGIENEKMEKEQEDHEVERGVAIISYYV